MCLRPIIIRNPYLGMQAHGLSALHDCESAMLKIPCGVCADCVAMRQMDISQRVYLAALDNYCAMFTLTYSPEALPHGCYTDMSTGESVDYSYASGEDISTMIRTLRQSHKRYFDGVPFKYMCVSELGGKRGRPHFHGILFFPRQYFPLGPQSFVAFCEKWKMAMFECWARNVGTRKHPVWVHNSRYVERVSRGKVRKTYDFHPIVARSGDGTSPERVVSFYVTKYLSKQFGDQRKFEYKIRKTALEPDAARTYHRRRCRMTMSHGLWTNGFRDSGHPLYSAAQSAVVQESVDYSARQGNSRFVFRMSDGTTMPMGIALRRRLTLHQTLMVYSDLPDGSARMPSRWLSYDESISREVCSDIRAARADAICRMEEYEDLYDSQSKGRKFLS